MMFAHCPHCCAELGVDVITLQRGHGQVQCPACEHAFNALPLLVEYASTAEPLAARIPTGTDDPEQPGLFDPPQAPEVPAPPPFSMPRRRPEGTRSNRALIGVCALLALLLGAQIAFAAHQSRIEQQTLQRALIELCRPLGCSPLPRRDIAAISLVSRDVRHHPTVEGALLITANLSNRSHVAVALPVIEIVLSDLSETRIAMRRFRASEYAADADLERRGLQPGSLLPVAFEVEDPGRDAVAFSFAFH